MPDRPTLILAGGFVGAGKTTLLLTAARLLHARGLRPAMITNDQGGGLVDTRLAAASGLNAAEIAGACFCCRFGDFIGAARRLLSTRPDVILAEPVGSCMDISATVLQPLKQYHANEFRLAPFSVLVDPARAAEYTRPDADPELAYLFRNQFAEADLLLFTKSDLYPDVLSLPGTAARRISARSGQGVAEWLSELMGGLLPTGARLLDVDYARYAAAEAALGWLNWEVELVLRIALPPVEVVGPFLESLDAELARAAAPIAHLKIFDRASTGYIRASICRGGDQPSVEGDLLASPATRHEIVVNLRACAAPHVLEAALGRAAGRLPAIPRVVHHQCFQPAPPVPEHRFTSVV